MSNRKNNSTLFRVSVGLMATFLLLHTAQTFSADKPEQSQETTANSANKPKESKKTITEKLKAFPGTVWSGMASVGNSVQSASGVAYSAAYNSVSGYIQKNKPKNVTARLKCTVSNNKEILGGSALGSLFVTAVSVKNPKAAKIVFPLLLGGYLYKFGSHYYQLTSIEQEFEKSLLKDASGKDFKFVSYFKDADNFKEIENSLKEKFFKKNQFCLQVKKNFFSPTTVQKKLSLDDVKELVNLEIKWFEENLAFIGSLSKTREFIIEILGLTEVSHLPLNEQMKYIAANKRKNLLAKKEDIQKVVNEGRFVYRGSSILFCPSFNPLSWSVAPHENKAKRLYWRLFVPYVYLLEIKENVDKIDWKEPVEFDVEKKIKEAKDKINALKNSYGNVDGNYNSKNNWIYDRGCCLELIEKVKKHIEENKLCEFNFQTLITAFESSGQFIHEKSDPQNDKTINQLDIVDLQLDQLLTVFQNKNK